VRTRSRAEAIRASGAAAELAAVRAEMLAVRDEGEPSCELDELPDEALAIVCHFLLPHELGRLACVSRRFTERTLREPGAAEGGGGGALLSPIEEGARLRLRLFAATAASAMSATLHDMGFAADQATAALATTGGDVERALDLLLQERRWSSNFSRGPVRQAVQGGGGVPVKNGQPPWLRALWYAEGRLGFTSCGPDMALSEDGASWLLPACARGWLLSACVPLAARSGRHRHFMCTVWLSLTRAGFPRCLPLPLSGQAPP
jgi:hypothetical protein